MEALGLIGGLSTGSPRRSLGIGLRGVNHRPLYLGGARIFQGRVFAIWPITTQIFDWCKAAGREPGILGYYRMLAQMRDAAEPD
jgi:hypothetical protein